MYPYLEGEQLDAPLFQKYKGYEKCKPPSPSSRFELGSLYPIPLTITITAREPGLTEATINSYEI